MLNIGFVYTFSGVAVEYNYLTLLVNVHNSDSDGFAVKYIFNNEYLVVRHIFVSVVC